MKKASYEIDMVNGPLFGKILRFSIPLMLSGILQLLFNAADIIVVGQFTGSHAMAAVGSTGSLNNLIINIFIGLSTGSSVLMAMYYGARDRENIDDLVHTSILLAIVSGAVLIVVGIALAGPLLLLMGTPDDVLPLAELYMRIVFCGMPALMIYNFGSGILRAVINVVLNLFFVIAFGMGVAGVALATIISQYISALLVLRCLIHTDSAYKLTLSRLRISKEKFVQIVRIGLPAGVSGAVFSISNVLIQSSVNSFGSITMAGNAAAQNIEGFIYTAMNSLYQASINFTSQNFGAGKYDRCRKVFRLCMIYSMAITAVMSIVFLSASRFFASIFTSDEAVLEYALIRMWIVLSLKFIAATYEVGGAAMQGIGHSLTPALLTVFGTCIFRLVWAYTVCRAHPGFVTLLSVYPVSWVLTGAAVLIAYFTVRKKVFSSSPAC